MNEQQEGLSRGNALMQQITARIEELAKATDAARLGTEMQRYLEAMARFHQYSAHNVWLILLQRPEALRVAGFHTWRKMNRHVKRGEHGILILAPVVVKENLEEGVITPILRGFRVVNVFDINQTEGEPLPVPPDWKSPEQDAVLTARLRAFARDRNISITVRALDGEIQGISTGGAIELAPTAGTGTLIHELAHEIMHRSTGFPIERPLRELEAEAVAHVVGRHFGLETCGAPNYLVLHGATPENVLAHMARIRDAATLLISCLESESEDARIAQGSFAGSA